MVSEDWYYKITPGAISLIHEESRAKFPRETGGILIGYLEGNIFYIEEAVGPGPRAIHKLQTFIRDGNYSQEQLDQIVIHTEGRWDYLGEWHSHPKKMGPSVKDFSSLRNIQRDSSYSISHPIMGLYVKEMGQWRFNCYKLSQSHQLIKLREFPSD